MADTARGVAVPAAVAACEALTAEVALEDAHTLSGAVDVGVLLASAVPRAVALPLCCALCEVAAVGVALPPPERDAVGELLSDEVPVGDALGLSELVALSGPLARALDDSERDAPTDGEAPSDALAASLARLDGEPRALALAAAERVPAALASALADAAPLAGALADAVPLPALDAESVALDDALSDGALAEADGDGVNNEEAVAAALGPAVTDATDVEDIVLLALPD